MVLLQDVLDKCSDNECHLSKDIYLAPLVVDRPCTIHGNGAVILCRGGADIQVRSGNVIFRDLYIEPEERETGADPLIRCKADTVFQNVIVRGAIDHETGTDDDRELPAVFDLGDFKANEENTFSLELEVKKDCDLGCTADCIRVIPERLSAGKNLITLKTDEIRNDVVIYAKLLLRGVATREIVLRGRALAGADVHTDTAPVDPAKDESIVKNSSLIGALPPSVEENRLPSLKKGQRVAIDSIASEVKIQIANAGMQKALEVDGYAFLLDEAGKARRDADLIFWGNKASEDGSVSLSEDAAGGFFSIAVGKVPDQIRKIAFCYSIYGEDPSETFRYVKDPYVRIFVDGIETERYDMTDLQNEKTVVAVELYRYKESWKIGCVGSGYRDGLKRLCESYGLEVAD